MSDERLTDAIKLWNDRLPDGMLQEIVSRDLPRQQEAADTTDLPAQPDADLIGEGREIRSHRHDKPRSNVLLVAAATLCSTSGAVLIIEGIEQLNP